ncbi:hypothetical protein GSI_09485 [Ganoderma sinense ZZ0214-1]|uniref:Uncharacterized protein n=1 Tax=Ganoderma sinense ZZ0214-1 TaxID=1077348 RepID=A0A2G8S3M5_9APHY|nr:hypothetical protein GSI_09485 [Ganoderma sinense ZZ0214-1]
MFTPGKKWPGPPYGSYANTPVSGTFNSPQPSPSPYSPAFVGSPNTPSSGRHRARRRTGSGWGQPRGGIRASLLSPHTPGASPFPTAATAGTPYTPSHATGTPSAPGTPNLYAHFPPTPGSATAGGGSVFAQQQGGGPPPPPPPSPGPDMRATGARTGPPVSAKKED